MAECYTRALESMQKAESMPRGDARQEMYINARRDFERAASFVESNQLFSDNETMDDIATADLKYLLIPAYLAKISISSECGPNRLRTFERAELLIKQFLRSASNYGLCDRNIDQIINSKELDNQQASTMLNSLANKSLESAMQTRAEKIENYKKMKLLEEKINQLEKLVKSGQQVDDEVAREYYLNLVKKWIADSVESLEREVKPALFFERNRLSGSNEETSSTSNRPTNEKTPQTFTIVRNDLQKQVFGLGYPSRPTVTVDEFINQKFDNKELSFQTQKEVYANSLQRYAEKPNLLNEQEELSDAEHDEKEDRSDVEELKKKRLWDEFKDENPRGSGNRHNMG